MTEVLDVKPEHVWSKMVDVSTSLRDHQYTVVKAGNSLSKSFTVARLALWFLYTHYPSTVITTAPSQTQVEEILWREIAVAHSNAKIPLGGELLKTSLDLQKETKGKKWFATGFATRPDTVTQQATRVQGFHNENVLVIMDEAAGVLTEIWDAVAKLLTTPRQKFLAIGNPTVAHGDFVNCFKDAKFNKITISVLDSPNYVAGSEVIPGLSGREFVEQTKNKYGEGSNYYKAMVLGEIPSEDVDALLQMSWIEAAEGKKVEHYFGFTKKFVTWDVADGGDDLHVIKAWENTTEIDSVELQGKKVEEAEPYVWRMLRKYGGNAIIVDGDGIGRVAISLLEQTKDRNTFIIPFFGSSDEVNDPQTFKYKRSEACWLMRNMFEKGTISIASIPEQREELACVKLVQERRGYITVEPKKELKKRIQRSPDRMDGIMMMAGMFDEIPIVEKTEKKRYRPFNWSRLYEFTPATV
jgi:hypothetical protein